jgi:hypothetical protein
MKDKDSTLIFEKYKVVCEGPVDFTKRFVKGVGGALIPSVTPGSAHAGLATFASGTTRGVLGIPNAAGLGLNIGSGLAGAKQASTLQKAVQAGQITQSGAAQMMASAKPKSGDKKGPRKLLKGSNQPLKEAGMSQQGVLEPGIVMQQMVTYSTSGLEQIQWVMNNIPEMTKHPQVQQAYMQVTGDQSIMVAMQGQSISPNVVMQQLATYSLSGPEQLQWTTTNVPEMLDHPELMQYSQDVAAAQQQQQQQQQQMG